MQVNRLNQMIETIEGLTSSAEVFYLYGLCQCAPKGGRIVEIGSYQGRSAIALCQAAREQERESDVILIDNFTPIQKRGWEDKPNSAKFLLENLDKLGYHPTICDSDSIKAAEIVQAQVAFMFIDSDHRPEHFALEMDAWQDKLMPGAIIACHDYANPNCAGLKEMIDSRMKDARKIGQVETVAAFEWPKHETTS